MTKERDCMILGYDIGAGIIEDIVALIIILSIHFIRRYFKRKNNQNKDEITKNQTEN